MTKIILIALPTAILAFAAGVWASGAAVAEEFYPTEPPLAYSGWTMRYNDLLAACYQGNMEACDHVASDKGMVSDTPIYNWAATCGGRLDIVTARRVSAKMFRNGILEGTCSYLSRQE